MPDILIFVSNRIDLHSEQIDNPIYVPVRCGAVFDSANQYGLLGDDTGDNISEKRMSFSEMTVQYWAWKNCDADYIGLCHYRRFLSFSETRYKKDRYNMVHVPYMLPEEIRRFGLLDQEKIKETVLQYDAVISEAADVKTIPVFHGHPAKSVRDWWNTFDNQYFPSKYIDIMLELIGKYSPEYLPYAIEYLNGAVFRGNNCFVLRKELFDKLCHFEFPVLFEIDRRIEAEDPAFIQKRAVGYLGEILYGIFFHALSASGKYRIAEKQLIYFRDASYISDQRNLKKKRALSRLDYILRPVGTFFFPIGSRPREKIKKALKAIRGYGNKK